MPIKGNGGLYSYSEDYKEACFLAWFRAGEPRMDGIVSVLPDDASGNTPNIHTVQKWMKDYNWRARADALRAEMSAKLEQQVVLERMQNVQETVKKAKDIADMAYAQIMKEGFDTSAAAVRGLTAAWELINKYSGIDAYLAGIGSMDNKQVENEILKLLGKIDENDNPVDDSVDVEAEEIPDNEQEADNS